jgi:Tol biopolymer transport system component
MKRSRLAFAIVVIALLGFISNVLAEEYKSFVIGGFSPDGRQLLLTYCTDRPVCRFGLFDLQRKTFSELAPQNPDQVWGSGSYSPDGARIAISVRRKSEEGRFAQIGILDAKTLKLTELSNSPTYKRAPSFSHDGKKIIFAQSNRERQSGMTRFSDWDIYEINSDGKNERRLTVFEFFSVTPPAYLPDDRRFIFSGDAPGRYVSPSGDKGRQAYKAQFQDNEIFVLPLSGEQRLTPFFTNGEISDLPVISEDGTKIVYTTRTDKLDGVKTRFTYDLFLFDGKNHRRLTRLDSLISDTVLSSDGSLVAVVIQPHRRLKSRELYLLDVKSSRIDPLDPGRLGDGRTTNP